MADLVAEGAEVKIRAKLKDTLAAVGEALQFEGPKDDERGAPVRKIAELLNLDISAARRRLNAARDQGLIENLESRPGRPGRYKLTFGNDPAQDLLPSVEQLRAATAAKAPRH